MSKAEDSFGSRRIQPFGQRRQHHSDYIGRSFQAIQGGVAPGSERGMARLAAKRLDPLGLAMLAIANQSVHSSVSVAKVRALPVRTGKPFGRYALGSSPSAFHLRPRAYRQRCWPSTHRGSGGETTGGAIVWRAGLEQTWERRAHPGCYSRPDRTMMRPAKGTQQRQKEDEQEHEHKHMDDHEAFSLFEMSRWDRLLLRRKNKDRREGLSSG